MMPCSKIQSMFKAISCSVVSFGSKSSERLKKKKKKALSGDKWSFLHLWFHALEDKELISLKAVIEGTVQSNTLTLDNFKQR